MNNIPTLQSKPDRRVDDSFMLPIYRRPMVPGQPPLKPALLIHFYVTPNLPSDDPVFKDKLARRQNAKESRPS